MTSDRKAFLLGLANGLCLATVVVALSASIAIFVWFFFQGNAGADIFGYGCTLAATVAFPVGTLSGFVLLRRNPDRLRPGTGLMSLWIAQLVLACLLTVLACYAGAPREWLLRC
jgi:hypothetical protein